MEDDSCCWKCWNCGPSETLPLSNRHYANPNEVELVCPFLPMPEKVQPDDRHKRCRETSTTKSVIKFLDKCNEAFMSDKTGAVLSFLQEQLMLAAALVSGYTISWSIPDNLAETELNYVATLARLGIYGLSTGGYLQMRRMAGDRFQCCFMTAAVAPILAIVLFSKQHSITWLIQVLPLALAVSLFCCTLWNTLRRWRLRGTDVCADDKDVKCEEGCVEKLIDDGCP